MTPPQDPLRTPENCGHQRIERFTGGDNVFSIWACGDCKLRFYPACSVCVDVGHRNVIHPALAAALRAAPAEPQPVVDRGAAPSVRRIDQAEVMFREAQIGIQEGYLDATATEPADAAEAVADIVRQAAAAGTLPVSPDKVYLSRTEPADGTLDAEKLAEALHGSGFDPHAEPWTWGSCLNWSPGWGDECGPDKHMDEARGVLRRLRAAALSKPVDPAIAARDGGET